MVPLVVCCQSLLAVASRLQNQLELSLRTTSVTPRFVTGRESAVSQCLAARVGPSRQLLVFSGRMPHICHPYWSLGTSYCCVRPISPCGSYRLTAGPACLKSVHTYVHMHLRAGTRTHTHVHAHARTHARTHARARAHARTHAHTHTHTHTPGLLRTSHFGSPSYP